MSVDKQGAQRKTFIVHGKFAMDEIRLRAARSRGHGVQVLTFEQMAARLAGGFMRPIDSEVLRATIQRALPETELGELDGIKSLIQEQRSSLVTASFGEALRLAAEQHEAA